MAFWFNPIYFISLQQSFSIMSRQVLHLSGLKDIFIMMMSHHGRLPHYWSFVRMMTSSNGNIFRVTGHLCGEFCARINGWVHNREAGDSRRHRTHYDVIVMRGLARLPADFQHKGSNRLVVGFNVLTVLTTIDGLAKCIMTPSPNVHKYV